VPDVAHPGALVTLELPRLDALVKQAAVSWARWQDLVRADLQAAKRTDPFASTRTVTGQSLLLELGAHKPSPGEAGLLEGLARWSYALMQARLSIPFVIEARILDETPSLVPAFAASLASRPLWRGALLEPAARANEYVKALSERSRALIGVEHHACEMSTEVARRLGYASPAAPLMIAGETPDFARTFVTCTLDLAKDIVRAEPSVATCAPPLSYARRELGVEASAGWPARLSGRWLEEVFAGLGGVARRMPAPDLGAVWGAMSFARALATLGLALRSHHVLLSRLPFAERAHPRNIEGQTLATAFAFLLLSPAFHHRALGLGRDAARDQARQCAGSLLLASRRALASGAVRAREWATDDAAYATYCGADPSPLMRALLCRAPRVEATAEAISFTQLMVNRFDEDWFRNPRAHQFLIDRAGAPAFATDRAAMPSAVQCGQWFESRV
jgi:hypothetical protein